MASFHSNNASIPERIDPNSTPATTFVQADPSNFRAVVQRLTGATTNQEAASTSTNKLPVSQPSRHAGKPTLGEMSHRRPGFKLHERRQSARKLEITLNDGVHPLGSTTIGSPSARQRSFIGYAGGGDGEIVLVSPVSTLDVYGRGSPRTPMSPVEEEEKAIAEKGFYLHPSPMSTPRGSEPPELLSLFPLHSPKNDPSSSSS